MSDSQEPSPASGPSKDDVKRMRAGFFENVAASIKHLQEASAAEGGNIRGSDYASIILVPLAALVMAIISASNDKLNLKPVTAFVFLLIILYFIGGRIGIVKSLNTRQAHLVWVIILATFILGCVFALFIHEIMNLV